MPTGFRPRHRHSARHSNLLRDERVRYIALTSALVIISFLLGIYAGPLLEAPSGRFSLGAGADIGAAGSFEIDGFVVSLNEFTEQEIRDELASRGLSQQQVDDAVAILKKELGG